MVARTILLAVFDGDGDEFAAGGFGVPGKILTEPRI
jgi:hypothetical protein